MGAAAKIAIGAGAFAILAGGTCWLVSDIHCERCAQDAVLELHAERGDVSAAEVAERVRPLMARAAWMQLAGVLTAVVGLATVFVAVRWFGAPARREGDSGADTSRGEGTT